MQYSSTNALRSSTRLIVDSPTLKDFDDFELAFLPYIAESDKKPLNNYFSPFAAKPRILLSHNDLLGLQMGPVVSKTGFSIDEIESNCTFCLNGHLHNGQGISKQILNLGNLTGKDFGEDALKYSHKIAIIDTDTFNIEFIENPFAFNFYKIEISTETDLDLLNKVKPNAIVSVKCVDKLVATTKELISNNKNILESRLIIIKVFNSSSTTEIDISDLTVDQCVKFAECCREKLENSPILEMELAEILK